MEEEGVGKGVGQSEGLYLGLWPRFARMEAVSEKVRENTEEQMNPLEMNSANMHECNAF